MPPLELHFTSFVPPRSNGRYRRRRPRISRRLPAPSVQQALTLRKRQISCRAASRNVEPQAPRDSGTRFFAVALFPSRWISGAPVEDATRATWNPGYTNFQLVKRYGLTHVTVCSMELRPSGAVFATPDSRVALSFRSPLCQKAEAPAPQNSPCPKFLNFCRSFGGVSLVPCKIARLHIQFPGFPGRR